VKRWRNDTPSAAAVPTDVTLRMVLKQSETGVKVLQREVRANLVYRGFTRVSGGKTPDAKTIGAGGGARLYVPSSMRRLTLDVGPRVTRMDRAEPHARRVSREGS
jgi:hypothetical protein